MVVDLDEFPQACYVDNGYTSIYFAEFNTPIAQEIKNKFLQSQSFLLKPPFVFTYSLPHVVNLDKFYDMYVETNNTGEMKRTDERIRANGKCTLDGTYGSWEVWVYAYTFFGYPIKVTLTCNNGL